MKKWIVTGGIGTGKSSFCQTLQRLMPELVLFSSDEAVHQAYESPEVRNRISAALGIKQVPGSNPEVFRAKVREAVIDAPAARKRLEQILHPHVWAELRKTETEAAETGGKVLVAEVPLYYETGNAVVADKIIVLAASQAVQLDRVRTRGVDEATALAMLKMQLPLSEKVALADMVVWNDGSVSALEQAAITLLRQV